MNNIDSKMTFVIWVFFLAVTAGESVAMLFFKGPAAFVLTMAGLLISLTGSMILDAHTWKRTFSKIALCIICGVVAFFCGHPLGGLCGFIPATLPVLDGKKPNALIASLYAAAGYTAYLINGSYTRTSALVFPVILMAAVALWAAISHLAVNYMYSLNDLQEALKASSLDSLSERKLREDLARQSELSRMNAKLEERERISRDIHNSVGHTLAAASVTLDAAALLMGQDDEMASAKMKQANTRVKEAMDSIRSAVRTLDSEDDSVLISDYAASLAETVRQFAMDTGVSVHHNLDMLKGGTKIPINIAAYMSGALTELLTNGIKHGKATVFVILMIVSSGNISLKVQDNGYGWGADSNEAREVKIKNGFGLRKMLDGARSLAGNMTIDGNDGFEVRIDLPCIGGK